MKNIHVLPTEKPSRLWINSINGKLILDKQPNVLGTQNIYITSDEEIKEGVDQWYLDKVLNEPYNSGGAQYSSKQDVIILTTDQDLIKDGVQAIDDEFLEWFVKNPSCESVNIEKVEEIPAGINYGMFGNDEPPTELAYKIIIPRTTQQIIDEDYSSGLSMGQIIPKEEPKQDLEKELLNKEL